MAKYIEKSPLDYRPGGDTIDDFAQKYMKEITRILQFLNNLRTMDSEGPEQIESEPFQMKVDKDSKKIYIRNSDNSEWIYLGKVAPQFGLVESIDDKVLTSKELLKVKGEVGKIVVTNENGLLDIDILGNAGKVAGKNIETVNIQDGETLVYRASINGFRNEPKGTVGSGKNCFNSL